MKTRDQSITDISSPVASIEDDAGEAVVLLSEPSSGSIVKVVPAIGSNVYRFQTTLGNRQIDVIAGPPDLATLRKLPTRWGAGVLFPYPGRVSGDQFDYRGETVRLLPDPATGNAMHGIVRRRAWRITDVGADNARGAWVQTSLNSREDNIPQREWPYAFNITLTIQLLNGRLRTEAVICNEDDRPMPFGLGFHPYFPTPLGPAGHQERCEITIPADDCWTGLTKPPAKVSRINPDAWPRRQRPIGDIEIGLRTEQGVIRNHWFSFRNNGKRLPRLLGKLIDPDNGLTVSVLASREFGVSIFYTPPGLPTASIEPHSCMPNAFNLLGDGRPDPGLATIEPGAKWSGWYEITPGMLDRPGTPPETEGLLS